MAPLVGAARRPWAAVAFALALLSFLVDAPGFGPWGLRLPVLAAAALALAFDGAFLAALRPDRLGAAAMAFAAAQALSIAATPDPRRPSPDLALLVAGPVLFFAARSGRVRLEGLPALLAAGGLVFAAIGLVQAALGREAVSTLGNRNYAGTLAAMLLPATAAFAFLPGRLRPLQVAATLALLAYLVVTDSRAGVLAAAAGTALAGAALAGKGTRRALLPFGALAVLVLALPFAVRGANPVSVERASTLTVRLGIWRGAARLLADRPWLGAGLGGFSAAFPPYRDATEARLSHLHATAGFREVEDAHSSWVQVAAESGPAGVLAWLAVVVLGAWLWWRRRRDADSPPVHAAAGAAVLAFLVGGLFNTLTSQPAHAALFWVLLGTAAGGCVPPDAARIGPWTGLLAKAGTAAAIFATLFAVAVAVGERGFESAMATSDPSLRLAALAGVSGGRAAEARASALLEQGRFEEAAREAEEALRLRPNGAVALNTLAVARLRGGDDADGEAVLHRALAGAPHAWLTHRNLGSIEFGRGNFAGAEREFARAEFLAERMPQLPYLRAGTLLARNDVPSALGPLRRARGLGFDVAGSLRRDLPAAAGDPRLAEFFR
jgi:O-antigen ligase/Flp pilus assembly protein TadD